MSSRTWPLEQSSVLWAVTSVLGGTFIAWTRRYITPTDLPPKLFEALPKNEMPRYQRFKREEFRR